VTVVPNPIAISKFTSNSYCQDDNKVSQLHVNNTCQYVVKACHVC